MEWKSVTFTLKWWLQYVLVSADGSSSTSNFLAQSPWDWLLPNRLFSAILSSASARNVALTVIFSPTLPVYLAHGHVQETHHLKIILGNEDIFPAVFAALIGIVIYKTISSVLKVVSGTNKGAISMFGFRNLLVKDNFQKDTNSRRNSYPRTLSRRNNDTLTTTRGVNCQNHPNCASEISSG